MTRSRRAIQNAPEGGSDDDKPEEIPPPETVKGKGKSAGRPKPRPLHPIPQPAPVASGLRLPPPSPTEPVVEYVGVPRHQWTRSQEEIDGNIFHWKVLQRTVNQIYSERGALDKELRITALGRMVMFSSAPIANHCHRRPGHTATSTRRKYDCFLV